MDIATSDYGLEPLTWGHVSGVLNVWADALSRLDAPEATQVPQELTSIVPEALPVRDAKWWRASRGVSALKRRGQAAGLKTKRPTLKRQRE